MNNSIAFFQPQICSTGKQLFKSCILTIVVFLFINNSVMAQEHNRVQTFTNANGLANNLCMDILREPNGTIWVTHNANDNPISKRNINGTWEIPSLAALPIVVVNGNPQRYNFSKVFRSSNGNIWFVPTPSTIPVSLMNPPPPASNGTGSSPLVVFNGIAFSALHPALNNFPDKGAVLDMVEDNDHNIWFACATGLIKMSSAGAFTTYTPPNFVYTTNSGHVYNVGARQVVSIDIDANNHPVMIVETAGGAGGNGLVGLRYVRRFKPATNEWDLWTLRDAPWLNAAQNAYNPIAIKASRNKDNRILITSFGGGMYYIDNNNYNSNDRTQIANFLTPPHWGTHGWPFDIIRTNLSDFPTKIFIDPTNGIWTLASTSAAVTEAYRYEKASPTTFLWNGSHLPATRHSFARRGAQITFNNNGATQRTNITGMSFAPANEEIWVSTEHGVERWYSDYPYPNAVDFIGIEGAGNNKIGIAAFNTFTNNMPEPAASGHRLNPRTPTISIDSAYYYLSTTDYDRIDSSVEAGLKGDGVVQGFPALRAALLANNLTSRDITIRFTPISLGEDSSGAEFDWTQSNTLEKRRYQKRIDTLNNYSEIKSHYEILLGNGTLLFKGQMPLVNLGINYNKYGYLMDSIAAHSDDVRLTRHQFITSPIATAIANAIEQDLGNFGVRFVFQSIQSAHDTSINTIDRLGGLFKINFAYLRKSDTAMALVNPLAGIYTIGNGVQDHFPNITSAVNALQTNGISAWVTFLLNNGVYNEQFALPAISGTNGFGNRPITFRSLNGDSTKVTIQFSPLQLADNYVFRHNGVRNLRFRQLHFKNTSTTFGRVIHLNTAANFNNTFQLNNCIVEGNIDAPATVDNDLVTATSPFDRVTIFNSNFINGNRALNLTGSGIKVLDNYFKGHKNFAINFGSAYEPEVSRNKIYGPSSGTFSGISMGSANNAFIVQQNKIVNTQVPGVIGINVAFSAAGGNYEGGNARIWNNEVVMATNATTEGIIAQSDHSSFYHNTVHLVGNNATSTAVRCGLVRANLKVENNIFSNPNGYAMVIWRTAAGLGSYFTENNHNVYCGSATPFKIHSNTNAFINYNNIAALRAISGRDANSREANPLFISNEILIPQNGAIYNLAPTIEAVTTDIRNRIRPNTNRDHGAYEFNSWSGAISGNWQVANNWTDGIVPNENGMAVLPGNGVANELVLTQPITINNMYVASQRNVTINAGHHLSITGTLINDGIITGLGNVRFNNGQQQFLGGNGSIRHIDISNGSGVSFLSGENNAVSVLENLSIPNGRLFTNDNLILKSTQTNTARVSQLIQGAIAGNVTVERFIPGKRAWRLLTAPLSSFGRSPVYFNNSWQQQTHIVGPVGTGLDAVTPAYNTQTYNNNSWVNITNTTTAELFGSNETASNKAFAMFIIGDRTRNIANTAANNFNNTTLRASGKLLQGTQDFNLGNLAANQYVLIGNPFASPIDLNQVFLNAGTRNINRTFYTWNPTLAGSGGYITISWDGVNAYDITPASAQTQIIQSGQAFFVHTIANAATNVVFEENDKSTININNVFGVGNGNLDKLSISLQKIDNGSLVTIDGVIASFGASFSKQVLPTEDAVKLFNNEEGITIRRGNNNLSIERRPFVTNTNDTIFLALNRLVPNTNYTLNLNAQGWDASMQAFLVDKLLSTETAINLQNPNQDIQISTTNATVSDRWIIVFKPSNNLPNNKLQLVATKKDKEVKLTWNIANEVGVKEYELQRSVNGVEFATINNQVASNKGEYNNLDTKANNGNNYYRVKTIMQNDNFSFSNIVNINLKQQTLNPFTVFPNPVKNNVAQIQLNNIEEGEYTIRLIDKQGKILQTQKIKHLGGTSSRSLDLSNTASGIYQLVLGGKGINKTVSLVKVD